MLITIDEEPVEIGPEVRSDVGYCDESCPHHDGKRCGVIGGQPSSICEPWYREAARQLGALEVMKKQQLGVWWHGTFWVAKRMYSPDCKSLDAVAPLYGQGSTPADAVQDLLELEASNVA